MSPLRVFVLTLLAMLAFACNSLLCRAALKEDCRIDAASFTTLRLVSRRGDTLVDRALAGGRSEARQAGGDWVSALALFTYAAAFSFAYLDSDRLDRRAAAVWRRAGDHDRLTRLRSGERFSPADNCAGLLLALGGLVVLLAPGLSAPPMVGAGSMLAGRRGLGRLFAAWQAAWWRPEMWPRPATSRARCRSSLALSVFVGGSRAVRQPSTLPVNRLRADLRRTRVRRGLCHLVHSRCSAIRSTTAATVQLSVPVLTTIAGIVVLGETPTVRLVLASVAILGGIALVIWRNGPGRRADQRRRQACCRQPRLGS